MPLFKVSIYEYVSEFPIITPYCSSTINLYEINSPLYAPVPLPHLLVVLLSDTYLSNHSGK